jgi:hypothetical protein
LNPDLEFLVAYSAGGSNLNGYSVLEMASFFKSEEIPDNLVFEEGFAELMGKSKGEGAGAEYNFS